MAKLHHTENGTPWLEITCEELSGYSRMERPVCDECLKSLVGLDNITLVPILNEAYCPECGPKQLPSSGDTQKTAPSRRRGRGSGWTTLGLEGQSRENCVLDPRRKKSERALAEEAI